MRANLIIINSRQLIMDNAIRPLRPTKYYCVISIVRIVDIKSLGAQYIFTIYALYFDCRLRLRIH